MSLGARRYNRKGIKDWRKTAMRRFLTFRCPECQARFVVVGIKTKKHRESTADCPDCRTLLLLRRGKADNFVEYMRKLHPELFKNGAKLYYTEI